ncbi:MAG: hypothetical protein K2X47_02040, partial [Bdellovibrionales bacterium]|nr:hypothetical protein [Bdellovibrionales bacterium]
MIISKSHFFMMAILSLVIGTSAPGFAAKKVEKTRRLSTNVNFEDLLVSGKYQYPSEATTTVENEKDLDDLIGARKHFRDRLGRSMD